MCTCGISLNQCLFVGRWSRIHHAFKHVNKRHAVGEVKVASVALFHNLFGDSWDNACIHHFNSHGWDNRDNTCIEHVQQKPRQRMSIASCIALIRRCLKKSVHQRNHENEWFWGLYWFDDVTQGWWYDFKVFIDSATFAQACQQTSCCSLGKSGTFS